MSFRSASDVALVTKQLRTVLEKGKTSLAEVDRKVLHASDVTHRRAFWSKIWKTGINFNPWYRWRARIEHV